MRKISDKKQAIIIKEELEKRMIDELAVALLNKNEGVLKTLLGAGVGFTLGPVLMKAICKVLGLDENGVLYKTLTSKAVLTALGAVLANMK